MDILDCIEHFHGRIAPVHNNLLLYFKILNDWTRNKPVFWGEGYHPKSCYQKFIGCLLDFRTLYSWTRRVQLSSTVQRFLVELSRNILILSSLLGISNYYNVTTCLKIRTLTTTTIAHSRPGLSDDGSWGDGIELIGKCMWSDVPFSWGLLACPPF